MSETTEESEIPRAKRFNRIRVYYRLHRKRIIASFVILSHTAGALTSVEAVMETRTPQGAVAWATTLNLFPYLAVPAYWVFGHTEFESYGVIRDLNREKFIPIREQVASSLQRQGLAREPSHPLGKMLESLSDLGPTSGNTTTLLVNGRETYRSMHEAIENAKHYILFQTYILRDDPTASKFKDQLIEKANQGVKIHVLYDEIGSLKLDEDFIREMLAAGIEVTPFTTNLRDGRKYQLNFRNHRKILVVDGKVGFTGGLNIGGEYLGKDETLTPWRDTHIRVSGPAATVLQLPFAEDWYWATGNVLEDIDWEASPSSEGGDATVICIPTGPADPLETCSLFFLAAINSAQERLWIATPYFVPDVQILSALKLAVLRGVDVRLIVPDLNDSTLVEYSSYSYLDEVKEAGIRTYRYQKGFLHQKTMVIDQNIGVVGSANMDNRSFRLNFEIILSVHDQAFAAEMERMFLQDFADSNELGSADLKNKPFHFRLLSRISRLLAPIQ